MSPRGSSTDRNRSLWRIVLVTAIAVVVADFAEYPTVSGLRAASPETDLALVMTAGDAGSALAADARALATALGSSRGDAAARSSETGTAETVLGFARSSDDGGGELLLLTSTALAELARGVRQPTSADEARSSAAALEALERLRPVAPIFRDPAAMLVRRGEAADFDVLLASLRARPGEHVLGIPADAASKATLAHLVARLGVEGEVRYRAFPSGADAAMALGGGGVDVVIAPRSHLLGELRRGRVEAVTPTSRRAARSGGWLAPTWAVLLGAPSLTDRARSALKRRIDRALRLPAWRRHARDRRLAPLSPRTRSLAEFVDRETERAMHLAAVVARVAARSPSG